MTPRLAAAALVLTASSAASAGGGPANVMVLYNADVPEATAVAEHYREARSLPSGHLCPLHGIRPEYDFYAGEGLTWPEYQMLVRAPFALLLLAARRRRG